MKVAFFSSFSSFFFYCTYLTIASKQQLSEADIMQNDFSFTFVLNGMLTKGCTNKSMIVWIVWIVSVWIVVRATVRVLCPNVNNRPITP